MKVQFFFMIHREALAATIWPDDLKYAMRDVITVVNNVKSSALNIQLFRSLCENMNTNADHKTFFHTKVSWLSRGNVLQGRFDARVELNEYLRKHHWATLYG